MQQKTKEQQKLCWNCEGSIPLAAENCPYCGVYTSSLSLNGKQEPLFQPPYKVYQRSSKDKERAPETILQPPEALITDLEPPPAAPLPVEQAPPVSSSGAMKNLLIALCCLLSGTVLAVFGLILLFFAQDGVLQLRWSSFFWPFYLLLATPLFYWGWKSLQALPLDDE